MLKHTFYMMHFIKLEQLLYVFHASNVILLCRSVREDQAAGLEGEAHRQEEEDDGQERQPQPLLQRVIRFHGRTE